MSISAISGYPSAPLALPSYQALALHQQKGVLYCGMLSYMIYIVYHDQICIRWQKTYLSW